MWQDGAERLLAETVRIGVDAGAVPASSLERISADKPMQQKAIAHLFDIWLQVR